MADDKPELTEAQKIEEQKANELGRIQSGAYEARGNHYAEKTALAKDSGTSEEKRKKEKERLETAMILNVSAATQAIIEKITIEYDEAMKQLEEEKAALEEEITADKIIAEQEIAQLQAEAKEIAITGGENTELLLAKNAAEQSIAILTARHKETNGHLEITNKEEAIIQEALNQFTKATENAVEGSDDLKAIKTNIQNYRGKLDTNQLIKENLLNLRDNIAEELAEQRQIIKDIKKKIDNPNISEKELTELKQEVKEAKGEIAEIEKEISVVEEAATFLGIDFSEELADLGDLAKQAQNYAEETLTDIMDNISALGDFIADKASLAATHLKEGLSSAYNSAASYLSFDDEEPKIDKKPDIQNPTIDPLDPTKIGGP